MQYVRCEPGQRARITGHGSLPTAHGPHERSPRSYRRDRLAPPEQHERGIHAVRDTLGWILSTADVAREFGLIPLPVPAGPARLTARAVSALPFLPPAAQWVEAASHPAIMDTTKAKRDLGWTPRFTALEALRDTLRPDSARR